MFVLYVLELKTSKKKFRLSVCTLGHLQNMSGDAQ